MYAVIQTGGKQYQVAAGDQVKIEKLPGEIGSTVTFDRVLLTHDGTNFKVGSPYVDDAKVTGRITHQGKNRKVVVFKYKRRKGYRRKQGHRQHFTLVAIENIQS
jgi:large subunit ribosomal protein L21